jgi:tRNA-2-methylthio-N6-dimethylallyladenosine synthase
MNENDSEKIAGLLESQGYIYEEDENKADIIIVNTCSVRDNADQRTFGSIGRFKKNKKNNQDFILGVCGCMMQQEHNVEKIKKSYPYVDIVFGTHNFQRLPEMLHEHSITQKRVIDVWDDNPKLAEDLPAHRKYPFKSYVTIMNGCNNFCTYCIVPYTRGREKSRHPESIIKEIEGLVADGVVEITLLGQNVNSYGKGMKDNIDINFPELLKKVSRIEGLKRIKFMTSHPKDISPELIDVMAKHENICNYLHLPVQAGSNKILKAMGRGYTKEDYLKIIDLASQKIPGLGITTDIIVGFPGETEEDFAETIDLVRKARYDAAFTFIYSKRQGTPAAILIDETPEEVVKERFRYLLDVLYPIAGEKNQEYIGKTVEVLVEEVSKNNELALSGRTETGKLVNFIGNKDLIGTFCNIRITDSKTFNLIGEIVE